MHPLKTGRLALFGKNSKQPSDAASNGQALIPRFAKIHLEGEGYFSDEQEEAEVVRAISVPDVGIRETYSSVRSTTPREVTRRLDWKTESTHGTIEQLRRHEAGGIEDTNAENAPR